MKRITNSNISKDDVTQIEELAESLSAQAEAMGVKGNFKIERQLVSHLAGKLNECRTLNDWFKIANEISSTIRTVKLFHSKGINDGGELLVAIANGELSKEVCQRLLGEGKLTAYTQMAVLLTAYPDLKDDALKAVANLDKKTLALLGWDSRKSPVDLINETCVDESAV